jgi:hypothetical protein
MSVVGSIKQFSSNTVKSGEKEWGIVWNQVSDLAD